MKDLLNIDLQLFADENQSDGVQTDTEPQTTETQQEKEIYTKEELEKRLQSEADKRVNEALKTHRSKWEKEYNEKLQRERKEAERLAKLSEDERQKELDKKMREEIEQREKQLYKKEMKLEAHNILSGKELPITFSDILIGETAEETHERITDFEKAFKSEVEKEVNKRLKTSTPRGGGTQSQNKGFDMNALIRGSARRR